MRSAIRTRLVSDAHLYLAMLASDSIKLEAAGNAADAQWIPVRGERHRVSLAFDHDALFNAALARVRGKSEYTSLPLHLLPQYLP
ncbi:MAG: hypothetical protein U1F34_01940 [Gammaproteobacteria bacterium]